MMTVGVRELKNRLSEYLRRVRSGAVVLVTDLGEVVAELAAPGRAATDSSVPPGLLALAKRNLVTIGAPGGGNLYPALPRSRRRKRTAAELLREERGYR